MAESDKGILNVAWHGKMYLAFVVVPVKCKSKVSCAFPVSVDLAILLEDACEMVNIVFVDVLHAKIVNDKGETDWEPIELTVSWCDSALVVSCFVKGLAQ